jgi:transcriptional regulator with XRE-family HTH domain
MNRIRELRKQMDLTQKELAKYLQIADSTLSYWEMGKYEPDNNALMKLSRFFQAPIDYILGGDFTKWDIAGGRMSYPDDDTLRLPDSDLSVFEVNAAYRTNGKNVSFVEPASVGSESRAPDGTSIPNVATPVTPSNTAFSFRNTQTAFDRIEFEGLTQAEVSLLAEYAEFIKSRRKKDNK